MNNELTIEGTEQQMADLFLIFQKEHPEVAEAMNVMGVTLYDYMLALSSLEEGPSGSGNARCQF
jgi:hypothetical protein